MSFTLEDVMYCHERNSRFHSKKEGRTPVVYPITIGENGIEKATDYYYMADGQGKNGKTYLAKKIKSKNIYTNLKKRHYIKIGEECPICYEGIFYKRDAQLTDCGHAFHYSCIQKYSYSNRGVFTDCPICREPICRIDKNRYSPYGKNFLDSLEDFWMNLKTNNPEMCLSNKTGKKVHITGTQHKKCHICKTYCFDKNA